MKRGGITGTSYGDGATIDSCWNQGFVNSSSFSSAGIVADNNEWIYDCYNAGTITGRYDLNCAKTVAGIVGDQGEDLWNRKKIYNCYNIGYLNVDPSWNFYNSATIAGGAAIDDCENVYSLASKYNHSATEVTLEELQSSEVIRRLQGEKIITKWCMDKDNLNGGCIIPIAQQDMKNGVYKMLPDVWDPITEVSIKLSDSGYNLKAFRYAYYGIDEATAVYSSESDVLSVTPEGIITPLKSGTAVVHVTFEESELAKECGFDVTVTVTTMAGDVNGDGSVDSVDLRLILQDVCGKTQLTEQQKELADVVKDGNVDSQDLRKILRYVCGKVPEL